MDRTLTSEERYRRAEELYRRRTEGKSNIDTKRKPNKKKNKFKKVTNQLIISVLIYMVIITIKSSNIDFFNSVIQNTRNNSFV